VRDLGWPALGARSLCRSRRGRRKACGATRSTHLLREQHPYSSWSRLASDLLMSA
jgi:hypothetical protein